MFLTPGMLASNYPSALNLLSATTQDPNLSIQAFLMPALSECWVL